MNPELVTKLQSFPGSPTLEKAQRQLLLTQIMEMRQEEWAAQLEHEEEAEEEEEGDDENGALDHV